VLVIESRHAPATLFPGIALLAVLTFLSSWVASCVIPTLSSNRASSRTAPSRSVS